MVVGTRQEKIKYIYLVSEILERRGKMLTNVIILAIEKAKKEFPNAIIWGAILYPETPDNPEEITVFGGCSEESWGKALMEGGLSLNFHKLQTYATKYLQN